MFNLNFAEFMNFIIFIFALPITAGISMARENLSWWKRILVAVAYMALVKYIFNYV